MTNKYQPMEDGVTRSEELWGESTEALLRRWRDDCEQKSHEHNSKGRFSKKLAVFYGVPSAVLPALTAPLMALTASTITEYDHWIHLGETVAVVTSGVCAAVAAMFDYSGKAERHLAFSARYCDLVTDIDHELSKPPMHRQDVDTFGLRVRMIYDGLNRTAPD